MNDTVQVCDLQVQSQHGLSSFWRGRRSHRIRSQQKQFFTTKSTELAMIQFKCVEAVGLHSIDQVWLAFGSARPVASTTVVVCSIHRPNRDLEMQTDSGSLYSLSIPRRDEKHIPTTISAMPVATLRPLSRPPAIVRAGGLAAGALAAGALAARALAAGALAAGGFAPDGRAPGRPAD